MSVSTAIRPDVFASFSDISKLTPKEQRDELDPEDVALSALSTHEGWKVLNEYIESMKREMDNLIETLIANGASFEDVGKVTVVANLTKEKLYAVQKRVTDSRDASDISGQ